MKINHNIAAIKSNTKLSRTNSAMQDSIERLSSGYRINKAADDAAGMAISQKMRTQIRGLEQASRNASDGISVIETAEGALNEVESMLQRMRELSVQATNETNTAEDREAIQAEVDQLNQEIDRISEETEFNTKKLLNGDADRNSYTNNTGVEVISITDAVKGKAYGVTVDEPGTRAVVTGSAVEDGAVPASGTVTINGESIAIEKGSSLAEAYNSLRALGSHVDVEVSTDGGVPMEPGTSIMFTALKAGACRGVEVYCDNTDLANYLGLTSDEAGLIAYGTDAQITLDTDEDSERAFETTATYIIDGNDVKVTDKDGFEMDFVISEDIDVETDVDITVLDAGPVTLQVGANEYQTITVSIPRIDTVTLGTGDINVESTDGASKAIDALDVAINKVSSTRAKLGAYENRLDHAINNLDTSDENITEALSRIEDADMAQEMTDYTQQSVLQQAGTSMLAQANQMPQTILSLLQ